MSPANICAFCDKRAFYGLGGKPTWLCRDHYAERKARVKRMVEKAYGTPGFVAEDDVADGDDAVESEELPGAGEVA